MNKKLYKNFIKIFILYTASLFFISNTYSQDVKINSITVPNSVNLCGDGVNYQGIQSIVTVNAQLLNGASGTFTIQLPIGFKFLNTTPSSSSTYSVNATNSNAPIITCSSSGGNDFSFTIAADCSYTTARTIVATATSGGSTVTSAFIANVNEPNIIQSSWTNDVVSGVCTGATIVRTTVIKNGNIGYAKTFQFQSINAPANVQIISTTIPSGALVGTVSGDTTKYTISGAVFPAGLLGTSYFEDQETITITQTIKVKGCTNLTGKYRTIFGCINTPSCQIAEHVNVVNLGTGVPAITRSLISDAPFPICNATTSTSSGIWQFTNTGVGTCAALKFSKLMAEYRLSPTIFGTITEVRMANATGTLVPFTGANITQATMNFTGFTSDPDGVGGFEDINGDGIFDELPVGASIRLYIKISVPLTYNTCNYYADYSQMGFDYQIQSLCGVQEPAVYWYYAGLPYVGRGNIELASAPSDMANGEFGYLEGSLQYEKIGWDCPNPVTTLKVVLPKGFVYDPTGSPLFPLAGNMGLTNAVYIIAPVSDTVTLTATNFFNFNYKIPVRLNCALGSGVGNIQVIAQYQCAAGCDKLYLGCYTYPITPHCPTPCVSGITIKKLKLERLSLGYTDYTYTTKVNPAVLNNDANPNNDINLNQASPCDTIKVTSTSAVTTAVVNSNFSFVITVPATFDNGYILTNHSSSTFGTNPLAFYTGTVNIGGGPGPLGVPTSVVKVGANWVFTFNFNGITPLAVGTTVTVDARFIVNKAAYPNAGHAAKIDYQVRGRFIENGLSCDDFGDHFYPIDNYLKKYGDGSLSFSGCDQANLNQLFWGQGYDYSFTNEVRASKRMDKIEITLPVGVNYDGSATWNNGVTGLTALNGVQVGNLLTLTPTVTNSQLIPFAEIFPSFNVKLKAGCGTPVNGSVLYKVFTTDFFHNGATACNDLGINDQIINNFGNTINQNAFTQTDYTYTKPSISISNATTTPTTNPFSWTFTVTNPSTAALSNVFLSFENPSNLITYITLEDVTAGSVAIPLTSYSGTKKWTAGGTAATIAGLATKTYKLTVTSTNCAPDSVIIKAGWDCNALPSNPNGYACALVQGKLYSNEVTNTAEIGIQANFSPTVSQPLGSTINFTGSFKTTNIGHVYSNVMKATLPNGLDYTTGTAQYEYPAGSGTWVNIIPGISVTGGVISLSFDFTTVTGVNGLFGAADASAGNDKINFRFSVTTKCGFSTDSRLYFDVLASSSCGSPVNSNTAYTNPIVQLGFSGYRWLGVNSDWFDPINWCANGAIPSVTSDVYIPNVPTNIYPLITTGAANCRRIAVDAGTSIVITNTGSLNIYGTITNNGIINAVDGGIGIGFASSPTIPKPFADSIIGSRFYKNTVKNLIIHETVSFTTNAYDTLKITGNLLFGNVNNKILTSWGNLTLVSNALGTANVNDLTNNAINSGNNITGNVIIERYLFAKKAWRLLATPITLAGSASVKNSWMEGVGGITNTLSTGYGTQTTGPGGTGAGFDVYSQRVSVKYYNPVADNYTDVTNTNNAVANSAGYYLFVRGDRSVTQFGLGSTTLRIKGQLLLGDQLNTIPATTSIKYFSLGNPYASRIKFPVSYSNISRSFTVWNPLSPGLYNLGAFETYVYNPGTGNYERPGGFVRNFIESGEAVFFSRTALGSNSTVTFSESDKGLGSSLQSRTGVTSPTLEILMYVRDTIGTNTYMADGVIMNFDKNYSNGLDNDDVLKLSNAYDNISIVKNNTKLIAERLQKLQATDTIKLDIGGMHTGAYRLDVDPSNISNADLEPFLVDKYTSVKMPLSFSDVVSYNFTINSTANSYAADRFMIVFKQVSTTALTTITAKRNTDNTITVNWGITNERNVEKYIVEQSNDAVNFTELSIQNPIANNGTNPSYEKLDAGATKANNWYRIKANNVGGTVKYSAIAMVAAVNLIVETMQPKMSINSNPILNGIINLRLENQVAGNYEIQVTNAVGQIMYKQKLMVQSNNVLSNIKLNNAAKGNYVLTVKNVDGNSEIIAFIIK